jgi:hypothetical protein
LFAENPPIITVPFVPKIDIDPSRLSGLQAVVASIIPVAPFLNFNTAAEVSSVSIGAETVEFIGKSCFYISN